MVLVDYGNEEVTVTVGLNVSFNTV